MGFFDGSQRYEYCEDYRLLVKEEWFAPYVGIQALR